MTFPNFPENQPVEPINDGEKKKRARIRTHLNREESAIDEEKKSFSYAEREQGEYPLLNNPENLKQLREILSPILESQPKIETFLGNEKKPKNKDHYYTPEDIQLDLDFIAKKKEKFHKKNTEMGQTSLDKTNELFMLTEIFPAIVVDCTKHWFSELHALLTSEYDDLKGTDLLIRKGTEYAGIGIDTTFSTSARTLIEKKLVYTQDLFSHGAIPEVKYVADEDQYTGCLLAPRFLLCVNKSELNSIVEIYLDPDLSDEEKKLKLSVNPFKIVLLEQMLIQADFIIDEFERLIKSNNVEERKRSAFKFAQSKYANTRKILLEQKETAMLTRTEEDYNKIVDNNAGCFELTSAFRSIISTNKRNS